MSTMSTKKKYDDRATIMKLKDQVANIKIENEAQRRTIEDLQDRLAKLRRGIYVIKQDAKSLQDRVGPLMDTIGDYLDE